MRGLLTRSGASRAAGELLAPHRPTSALLRTTAPEHLIAVSTRGQQVEGGWGRRLSSRSRLRAPWRRHLAGDVPDDGAAGGVSRCSRRSSSSLKIAANSSPPTTRRSAVIPVRDESFIDVASEHDAVDAGEDLVGEPHVVVDRGPLQPPRRRVAVQTMKYTTPVRSSSCSSLCVCPRSPPAGPADAPTVPGTPRPTRVTSSMSPGARRHSRVRPCLLVVTRCAPSRMRTCFITPGSEMSERPRQLADRGGAARQMLEDVAARRNRRRRERPVEHLRLNHSVK